MYSLQCTVYSVQCTVPVFVLSVSARPSVTRRPKLSRLTASRQLLLGENTLHTEGGGKGETENKVQNILHKFRTISTKPLVKDMTVILKVILKVVTNI